MNIKTPVFDNDGLEFRYPVYYPSRYSTDIRRAIVSHLKTAYTSKKDRFICDLPTQSGMIRFAIFYHTSPGRDALVFKEDSTISQVSSVIAAIKELNPQFRELKLHHDNAQTLQLPRDDPRHHLVEMYLT